MAYKYDSILKTFSYSKEKYKIISDFLLSGDITNPNILLNVTKITSELKPNLKPKHWFELSSTVNFVKALIRIKLKNGDKKLKLAFKKWLKTEGGNTALGKNADVIFTDFGQSSDIFAVLERLNSKQLLKLMKEIGLVSVKKGGANLNGEAIQGTWIHKDLAVKYAEWLDPEFSIWISQKIQELINDGVSWNEIRDTTKMDYKPLTDAIKKHIIPQYPKMDTNIVYGQIANYINLKVMGQKAKEIRADKKIRENELTRDYFQELELHRIEKVQIFAEILISQFQIYDFQTLQQKISQYHF